MELDIRLGKRHKAKAFKPLWWSLVAIGGAFYLAGLFSLMLLASLI